MLWIGSHEYVLGSLEMLIDLLITLSQCHRNLGLANTNGMCRYLSYLS